MTNRFGAIEASRLHRPTWWRWLWLGLLVLSLWLGWVAPGWAFTEEQKFVSEVWRIVDRAYLDDSFNHQNWWKVRQQALKQPLQDRDQAYSAVQKMLASLDDPYTRFLTPDQYRSLQTNTAGELTGVGLQIASDKETGRLRVIAPVAGSPAEQAGIQTADIILEIDGVATEALTLDEAAARMRGPRGSEVTLLVAREGEPNQAIALIRDRIELNPVIADLRPVPPLDAQNAQAVGYIRLTQFNANATAEVSQAIRRLAQQGATSYILDLRNNPGGLLQAGVEVARLWLERGTIVYTVNRQGALGSFEATGQALTDAPLVVLVNRGTASASEILAGALQDNGRATLVGDRTFGKGLIQSLFDLSDGSGVAVTIAKYETPNHTDINQQGIQPDIVVPLPAIAAQDVGTAADNQYQAALELLTTDSMLAGAAQS